MKSKGLDMNAIYQTHLSPDISINNKIENLNGSTLISNRRKNRGIRDKRTSCQIIIDNQSKFENALRDFKSSANLNKLTPRQYPLKAVFNPLEKFRLPQCNHSNQISCQNDEDDENIAKILIRGEYYLISNQNHAI